MKGYLLFLLCSFSFLFNCGSSSEVEGRSYVLEGKVVYQNGEAVAGAKVRIRPYNYLPFYARKLGVADTITNENGQFFFDTLPIDSYVVEINKDGIYGALQGLTLAYIDTNPLKLSKQILFPTGSIRGKLNLPISDDTLRPLIALYSVDYLQTTTVTQDFEFKSVPPGVYSLRITQDLKSSIVMEVHNIGVKSDSVTDIGCLNLRVQNFFNGCRSPQCDSLVVRTILDANGLFNVDVNSVVKRDSLSNRIVALDLSHMSLKAITKDIGSLSMLRILDIRNNELNSLPSSMEYLGNLQECYLDYNNLCELPYEFTYLNSLRVLSVSNNILDQISAEILGLSLHTVDLRNNKIRYLPEKPWILPDIEYLYLDSNQISSLPARILQIFPKEFTVTYNRLCTVDDEIGQKLNLYDLSWSESQECNETQKGE